MKLTTASKITIVRVILIPVVVALMYLDFAGHMYWALLVFAVASVSDFVDGYIARHYNQVSNFGKFLDPLADKLTQGVVALCLAIKFPVICPALLVFILKELVMLCGAILLLKKKKRPCAARWYGKVATVMFYVSVALIVVMDGFLHVEGVAFQVISYVLLGLTAAMMIYSAVKYAQIFLKILRSDDSKYDLSLTDEIRAKTVRDKRIKS